MSDQTETQPIAVPVQAHERIEFIDILRGMALFGVLAINMGAWSGQEMEFSTLGWLDRAVVILLRFLLMAKFYSLLSLLFGWGMAVQMRRAETRGTKFVLRYLQRLLVLLAFGALHAILLWDGDILILYTLLGFLLLLFRKRSEKTILIAAGLFLALSIVLVVPGSAMDAVRARYADLTAFLRSSKHPQSLYGTGSYLDVTRLRIQSYLGAFSRIAYYIGNLFSMFLLGLYIGKRRLFAQPDPQDEEHRHLPLLRAVLWAGLGIGLVFNAIFVWTSIRPPEWPAGLARFVSVGARTIGAPALMLFYISAIILLVRKEAVSRFLAPLASLGRMSLSNYLLQSIVCSLIFYGYGLGLYGEVGPALGLGLTIVIYFVQIRLSEWWLDRYQFGPAEWLWRTLTYGRRQPLRLGVTYSDLGPSKIRQALAKVNSRTVLAVVWIVLLIWAGALGAWYVHLERTTLETPDIQASAARTPVATREAGPGKETEGDAAIATPQVQPVAYRPGPIAASGDLQALAAAFDAEAALAQIEVLTGPPYLGRYAGSPEGRAAGEYIAAQFADYGLQPAGDDGTYFQSFPIEYVTLAQEPVLVVENTKQGTTHKYVLHQDYSPIARGYAGSGTADGQVIWADDCAQDDLAALEVVDKIVLCRATSFNTASRNAVENGAAGLLLLGDAERRPADFRVPFFDPWIPKPIPVLQVFPEVVEDLLRGSGRSVTDLSLVYSPFALPARVRMQVQTTGPEACPESGCRGRNVLGVLPGRDPDYADQVIVIGAHYDHLGQAPDGTVWPGANDNASGVAVVLEIARSWQEQGYVPQHTVLFAAWDAEEIGLVGSSHYVAHPRYPLEHTVAMIQLDMSGAGSDTLYVDGPGELAERLRAAANELGLEVEISDDGASDHVPFRRAGIPASVPAWAGDYGDAPELHRPQDTLDVIDVEKLEAIGRIVGITTLGITEGEPDIADLLARRASALQAGDLDAFTSTSHPQQAATDRSWFDGAQALAPESVEMNASNVRVRGREATANVKVRLTYPAESEGEVMTKTLSSILNVKFAHGEDGWRWAGPNLEWLDQDIGFAVAHPTGQDEGLDGLGQLAAQEHARIAGLLGLPGAAGPGPAGQGTRLMLFSGAESLRTSVAPALPRTQNAWVGPDTVKLVYSPEISASLQLSDALTQLVLARAGVTEQAAPWLWQGLPLALRGARDPVAAHAAYLDQVRGALTMNVLPQNEATSWAAVVYLQQQIGWQGVGQFIASLGQRCREGLCDDERGLNAALSDAMNLDAYGFSVAWQRHWRDRLDTAQADLDAVLDARVEAILAGDKTAFLNTVDSGVPNLLAEQRHWFDNLGSVESLDLTGRPLALLPDQSLLASVTVQYHLSEVAEPWGEASVPLQVLFTPEDEGYLWAGAPLKTLQGDQVTVLYPKDRRKSARALLPEAEAIYARLADDLGIEQPDALTVKLYGSGQAFRTSVSLAFPLVDWAPAWTGDGASVKLWLRQAEIEDIRPTLTAQLARHLLHQAGVDEEWLVTGASLYLSRDLDGGAREQAAASHLRQLQRAVTKETLSSLSSIASAYALSEDGAMLARAQAWDAVRYLAYAHGQQAFFDLLHQIGQGKSLDLALEETLGQALSEFEAAWAESLARAHVPPEQIEIARAFDPDVANQHTVVLASPELEGRQAGSPGAEAAADYIATRFAEYGLLPAGDLAHTSYLQQVPITYTTLLLAPRLEIAQDSRTLDAFTYRRDFSFLVGARSQETAAGELVWVQDQEYGGMDLEGKIVLRKPSQPIPAEMARAAEHGARALVLVGNQDDDKEYFAKNPLPLELPPEGTIPVLELTQEGYSRLLEVTGYTQPDLVNSPPAMPLGFEARLEVLLGVPEARNTVNVLAWLPGSDPVLGQEVILLGAHYDHVGNDPDALACPKGVSGTLSRGERDACERETGTLYLGANDDASGIGTLLEIARLWHETGYRPQRSVLFAAWGAQELGELGSRTYVAHPSFPLTKTVAMLQLDAVGGGSGHYMEAQGLWEREGLLLFACEIATKEVDGRLKLSAPAQENTIPDPEDTLYLAPWEGRISRMLQSKRSDQAPFRQARIPTLLITWRGSSEENWPEEIADEVEPYRLGVTGRMVTFVVMSLAR
jgi:uncharacterized protein